MKLTIITINYNNAIGLEKTMQSVLSQTSKDFEYIVIDGGSIDNSVEVIKKHDKKNENFLWLSEKDDGIYHAMNKGIRMAKGDFLQFVNSGDCLVNNDVTEQMLQKVSNGILYGNMLKMMPSGIFKDKSFQGRQPTMIDFYGGTLNHSSAYIKRTLFDKYGLYDESLKIVSDWKWYLKAIVFGNESIEYTDVDVTFFDMTGISEMNKDLDKAERLQVLKELLPEKILQDYQTWSFSINQLQRINRYPLSKKIYYYMERFLFKIEKKKIRKNWICFL